MQTPCECYQSWSAAKSASFGAVRFGRDPRAKINVSTPRVKLDGAWDNAEQFTSSFEKELREGRGVTVDIDERVQVYIV